MSWRMKKPCKDCPFTEGGTMEASLRPGRLQEIQDRVLLSQPFHCHKTVHSPRTRLDENDQPVRGDHWRECAGALAYRQRHGRDMTMVEAALERILGRILERRD